MKIEVKDGNFYFEKKREHASFLYREPINFTLEQGQIMTILGPNGAGKTTLLKCITGLLDWKTGATYIDNVPASSLSPKLFWQKVGYVPQAHKLVFGFSIIELVIMGRAPYISSIAKPRKQDYDKAREALQKVGIAHLEHQSCNEVSGGELQLALIARALVSDPEILILDEPESHLDIQKQVVILQTLKKLAKENQISAIINTHYPNHAFYLADQVLLIAKHKKPLIGKVAEIMTEQQMMEYFNIELRNLNFVEQELMFETMVPLALAAKRDK